MNLIDRDHLLKKANEERQEGLITDDDLEAVYYELADEPTVEAIPIEWISEWYERYSYAEVGDLLNDWAERKKNEDKHKDL